jgi:cytochrome P450
MVDWGAIMGAGTLSLPLPLHPNKYFTKFEYLFKAICGKDSRLTQENFDEILHAFEKCLEAVQANLTTVLPHSLTRFFARKTSRQREFIKAAKTVRSFAREVIETRERKFRETHDEARSDILAYILDIAKNDPNFTMEEKIDEVVTFFVAGKK